MNIHLEALEALGITGETAEAVLKAAADEREALEQERDALSARLEEQESARRRAEAETAVRDSLRRMGAEESVLPLLAGAVPLEKAEVRDGSLVNEAELLSPLRSAYGALFHPDRPLAPPLQAAFTPARESLAAMSAEEINRNWDQVKTLLGSL